MSGVRFGGGIHVATVMALGVQIVLAQCAMAGVWLSSFRRSLDLFGAGESRTLFDESTGDWRANAAQTRSGPGGYWNGATQYSSFVPEGSAGAGDAMFAHGSVRSMSNDGTFSPPEAMTARSKFEFGFWTNRSASTRMSIRLVSLVQGDAAISVEMRAVMGPRSPIVWSHAGPGSRSDVVDVTAPWPFSLTITASSRLAPDGRGGHAEFWFDCNFFTVPGPSALALVSLSAFLRRRRA